MIKNNYLLGSRVLTHILFWVLYYILFSLIWAKEGRYFASFGLEFILIPLRILASYFVIYFLIPRQLLKGQELKFGIMYLIVILFGGLLQRIFTYYFYELVILEETSGLLTMQSLIKSVILINSTVLFLSALKIFKHWKIQQLDLRESKQKLIEIRANKRNYRINTSEIMYVEALGNHVIFYLTRARKLISYISLKEAECRLPENFMRSHKSFLINKDLVESYNSETVDISGRVLPISRSIQINF